MRDSSYIVGEEIAQVSSNKPNLVVAEVKKTGNHYKYTFTDGTVLNDNNLQETSWRRGLDEFELVKYKSKLHKKQKDR